MELCVFEEFLNGRGADPFHRFAVNRAHRRLPDSIDRKHRNLDRAIAMVKLEARVSLDTIAAAFQSTFVMFVADADVVEMYCNRFRAVGKNMQVDGRIFVGRAGEYGADEPR